MPITALRLVNPPKRRGKRRSSRRTNAGGLRVIQTPTGTRYAKVLASGKLRFVKAPKGNPGARTGTPVRAPEGSYYRTGRDMGVVSKRSPTRTRSTNPRRRRPNPLTAADRRAMRAIDAPRPRRKKRTTKAKTARRRVVRKSPARKPAVRKAAKGRTTVRKRRKRNPTKRRRVIRARVVRVNPRRRRVRRAAPKRRRVRRAANPRRRMPRRNSKGRFVRSSRARRANPARRRRTSRRRNPSRRIFRSGPHRNARAVYRKGRATVLSYKRGKRRRYYGVFKRVGKTAKGKRRSGLRLVSLRQSNPLNTLKKALPIFGGILAVKVAAGFIASKLNASTASWKNSIPASILPVLPAGVMFLAAAFLVPKVKALKPEWKDALKLGAAFALLDAVVKHMVVPRLQGSANATVQTIAASLGDYQSVMGYGDYVSDPNGRYSLPPAFRTQEPGVGLDVTEAMALNEYVADNGGMGGYDVHEALADDEVRYIQSGGAGGTLSRTVFSS